MPSSDALIVVEDWISEHFFTTDARKESFQKLVLDRRKQWDGEDVPTTRTRFTERASKLATMLAALYSEDLDEAARAEAAEQAHEELLRVLGYSTGEFRIRRDGPVRWFSTAGIEQSALAVVTARPVETPDQLMVKDARTLPTPWRPSEDAPDSEEVHSTSRLVSTLFAPKEGPSFALIMAGRWLVVAEKGRWPEGRYLAVDVQTVAERADLKKGGEVDRALTCLEAASLAPDADGHVWWSEALDESIKHTVGVSQDLREGVRESIEIIANEVVSRRRDRGLEPLSQDQAQPLAMQSLRFLYRILFLLYAEASPELGVLPGGSPTVRFRLLARQVARTRAGSPRDPAVDGRHPPVRKPGHALPARRPGQPGGCRRRDDRPELPQPARRSVPSPSDCPHRRGGFGQPGAAAGAGAAATE